MLILALVPYGYRVPSRFPLPIFVTTQLWGDFHFPVCLLSCPLQNPGQTRATSISDPNSEAEQSSLFSFFCDSSHNFAKVWFLGWGFWNLSYVWRRGANKYISLVFQLGSLVCLRCPHHAFWKRSWVVQVCKLDSLGTKQGQKVHSPQSALWSSQHADPKHQQFCSGTIFCALLASLTWPN